MPNRQIEIFQKRFGRKHLIFASHAAFPLAVTPELLYQMWATFQRDIYAKFLNIPWIAVSDFLLSGLCEEVGYGMYEVEREIRDELLSQLQNDKNFGNQRIEHLANFIHNYVHVQLYSEDTDERDYAQSQNWTALAYTQPKIAAKELTVALSDSYQTDKLELLRIAALVQALSKPLAQFPELLAYAQGMSALVRGNERDVETAFDKLNGKNKIAEASLHIPDEVAVYFPRKNEIQLFENIQPQKLLLAVCFFAIIGTWLAITFKKIPELIIHQDKSPAPSIATTTLKPTNLDEEALLIDDDITGNPIDGVSVSTGEEYEIIDTATDIQENETNQKSSEDQENPNDFPIDSSSGELDVPPLEETSEAAQSPLSNPKVKVAPTPEDVPISSDTPTGSSPTGNNPPLNPDTLDPPIPSGVEPIDFPEDGTGQEAEVNPPRLSSPPEAGDAPSSPPENLNPSTDSPPTGPPDISQDLPGGVDTSGGSTVVIPQVPEQTPTPLPPPNPTPDIPSTPNNPQHEGESESLQNTHLSSREPPISVDSSAERAMLVLQNEAAALMRTFPGNVVVTDFNSIHEGQLVVGYTAIVKHSTEDTSLTCTLGVGDRVTCNMPNTPVPEYCSLEQQQEDIWVRQFVQNTFSSVDDYTVRLYRSIHAVTGGDHLCINVYDVRNSVYDVSVFVGAIPVRLSSNATTYYSITPLDGIDYQVILNSDGSYTFRRSQGSDLLYEGYSR